MSHDPFHSALCTALRNYPPVGWWQKFLKSWLLSALKCG